MLTKAKTDAEKCVQAAIDATNLLTPANDRALKTAESIADNADKVFTTLLLAHSNAKAAM